MFSRLFGRSTAKVLICVVASHCGVLLAQAETEPTNTTIKVTVNRGTDRGQNFGTLFEATSDDGSLVIGAGFTNAYNTRYRSDRHTLNFFVRPSNFVREYKVERLPRPNDLCGTYLFTREGSVYSTYGGLKVWNPDSHAWQTVADVGGTQESMRVGNGVLVFGDSTVIYNNKTILAPPEIGSYQLFFYANGHLCFYHIHRNDKPYRPFEKESDGFSRLYACPWEPGQENVDLSNAKTLLLPVVGETTFAWGANGNQIVTGSNIGGFYLFDGQKWEMLLEPKLGVSYQLYSSMAFHNSLLMGQYPTGRLFQFDGETIVDKPGWPPVPANVSASAREAQTTVIYGGEILAGVWPWGELWRYHPDQEKWSMMQRMFDHPETSKRVTHPYDEENQHNAVKNLWGQRVTSLVCSGTDLFISTSAKFPCEWEPKKYPFLANNEAWKSYGSVYRLTMPGHLSAATRWTEGPTTFEFRLLEGSISISQDGQELARAKITGTLAQRLKQPARFTKVAQGKGIYGPVKGSITQLCMPTE